MENNLDMTSSRLEAFSDGVIAIIITIMVLELKVPHPATPGALLDMWPIFLSYALSFFMVAVYWINHHHLFHHIKRVDARILWANIFLLFCISFIPFFTSYMNEHEMLPFTVACYSATLLVCAFAYRILNWAIRCQFKEDSHFLQLDRAATHKNWAAVAIYIAAIALAYIHPMISFSLNFIVACMYAMPNFFFEKRH